MVEPITARDKTGNALTNRAAYDFSSAFAVHALTAPLASATVAMRAKMEHVQPECVLLKPVNMRAQTAADGSGWLPTVNTLQADAHMHEAERLRATGQDPGRAVAAAILAARKLMWTGRQARQP